MVVLHTYNFWGWGGEGETGPPFPPPLYMMQSITSSIILCLEMDHQGWSHNPVAVKTCGAHQRLFLQGDVLDYNLELRQVNYLSPPEDFSGCANRDAVASLDYALTDFVCCCCYCHFHFLFGS